MIAFTAHHDRATVLEMLEAGAVGYLLKGGSVDAIVEAIEQAAAGQSTFSVEVTGDIVETLVRQLAVQRKALEKKQRQEKRIRRALDSEGVLEMVFQPICTLGGKTVGVEALARFRARPCRAPDRWFAEAEEVGLRRELELAAVKAALAALPDLPPKIYLSLNVSPKTVLSAGLRKLVARLRAGTHRDRGDRARPDRRLQAAQRGVRPLRELGVRFAVDDAGAGFASLRHILRLAPDFIKLDRTLIDGIQSDRSRQALAAGLISFAERIDATIIAEGIEKLAELNMLASLGVGHGQGFFLARPGPLPLSAATTPMLARKSRAVASG